MMLFPRCLLRPTIELLNPLVTPHHPPRRKATVKASTNLIVLSLDRQTFVDVLGPLQNIMNKEKSAEVGREESRGRGDHLSVEELHRMYVRANGGEGLWSLLMLLPPLLPPCVTGYLL